MFQRIVAFITIIVSIIIIFIGYLSWNQKIGQTAQGSNTKEVEQSTDTNEVNTESKISQSDSLSFNELKESVKNLPDSVQQIFKEAYVNKELVNIAFVGSASTGNDENGWSKLAKNELENYYGTNLLSISIYEFDGTSTDFLNSDIPDQIIDKNPDIVFLESFRLADNSGLVPVDIAQENLTTFIEQISTEVPEVAFIIQPPNPLASAVNYPLEIEELKQFIESKGIPYFNHWENWPTENSVEMTELLNDGLPNEQGHKLWADAVINYFIAQQ